MRSKTGDGQILRYTTVKARLYPTPEQETLFEKTFGCCRWLWNTMLADQQRFYLETGAHYVPAPARYKDFAPFLREVDNQALIQEHGRLLQAFRSFFRNPAAFQPPAFKRKKDARNSFTACNHAVNPTIWLTKDGVRMTKAGVVRASLSRRPCGDWKLKRISVEKTKSGKYFCYLVYEWPVPAPQPITPTPETTLGLKYSAAHFYVADNGDMADPPSWLKKSQEKLSDLQRRLDRMQPGSGNYRETLLKYYRLHEHIVNQRRDFIHQESRRIANAWDAVCIRADDLQTLARLMPRGAAQAGFGAFRECLRYKLERQGKQLIEVDRAIPTTRLCHSCGALLDEAPDYRKQTWTCPHCGRTHSRELNAARNIKAAGLASLAPAEHRQEQRKTA